MQVKKGEAEWRHIEIGRDHVVFSMDPAAPPVLRIRAGDTVIFDTRDSLNGVIRSEADLPSQGRSRDRGSSDRAGIRRRRRTGR